MATRIDVSDANAWLESTKLTLSALEDVLAGQIETQILARLAPVFSTITWIDANSTPKLVKSIIAMYYAAAVYDRAYTDDNDTANNWASILRNLADTNISGLLSGSIVLAEDPSANSDTGTPIFFPNDLSSSLCATEENPSDGGPAFSMGTIF